MTKQMHIQLLCEAVWYWNWELGCCHPDSTAKIDWLVKMRSRRLNMLKKLSPMVYNKLLKEML